MTENSFLANKIDAPEVVLGIVSPVGTDISDVLENIKYYFEDKGYFYEHIKVSTLFAPFFPAFPKLKEKLDTQIDRINCFIDLGDRMRKKLGNDILAALAIYEINERRLSPENKETTFEKRVFVVDQLKTEAELDLLKEVYGDGFFQVSVYSARDIRVDNLARAEAHSHLSGDKNPYRDKAEAVVNRDEDERKKKHGQKVGKIFQLADFVINADSRIPDSSIEKQVKRFVELLFSSNKHSPTHSEYGMYLAHSAALRSLDLSRQVGAAIFRATGEIAALGTNEVPKAGGGTYWSDDVFDAREYKLRRDSNDARKLELLSEVVEIATSGKKLPMKKKRKLEESQFMDALEYGRIVHAEMCALTDAARLGISVSGGIMYCTTLPCHMCAKHIVAAGIKKLVFLEPYPKSLTPDMHSDSVAVEGTSRGLYSYFPSVEFTPFNGITPRRYRDFFLRGKRKSDGKFQEYKCGTPHPIFSISRPWYADRETKVLETLETALDSLSK